MKVLVCGGAGFIGQPLVRALVAAGHEVTATVHSRQPSPKIEGVKYPECDLTFRASWNLALGQQHGYAPPDMVYMVAGKTGGSGLDPLHFVTDNALMHLNLFRSCAEFGVRRIVAMSSTTGYPNICEPMIEEDYFTGEPHPAYFNPGHTRRFIERLAAMYPQIATTFIRCAGAYGPGDDYDPKSSHVIAATVRKVAEMQDPIVVWGDGTAEREGTYIDDLVAALVQAAKWPYGAYNIGPGEAMSVNQMLQILMLHNRHRAKIEYDSTKPQMIAARRLDNSRARYEGWKPKVAMLEGLCRTLDWCYEKRR